MYRLCHVKRGAQSARSLDGFHGLLVLSGLVLVSLVV